MAAFALLDETKRSLSAALEAERREVLSLRLQNKMVVDVIQSSGLFAGYLGGGAGDEGRLAHAFQFYGEAKKNWSELQRTLSESDVRGRKSLKRLQDEVFASMDVVAENCKRAAKDKNSNAILMLYQSKPLLKKAASINDIAVSLMEDSEARRNKLAEKQKSELDRLSVLTQCVLLFNIIFVAVTLFLFRQSLVQRLDILISKSRKLSEQVPLGKLLDGADEFAAIDKVLHEAADNLQESEEFKSRVVSMVAHDMRSPLASAMATVEIMEAEVFGELSAENKKQLAGLNETLKRQVELIGTFLDTDKLSKRQLKLDFTTFQTSEIFDRAVSSLRGLAELRSVEILPPPVSLSVNGDKERLAQVLINLISNAVKFSPRQSQIRLEVENDGEEVLFRVIDGGPGISERTRALLFQQFSETGETDTGIKGSGLGLYLCKWFVEAHGGTIGVDANETGSGSTFWFAIPR